MGKKRKHRTYTLITGLSKQSSFSRFHNIIAHKRFQISAVSALGKIIFFAFISMYLMLEFGCSATQTTPVDSTNVSIDGYNYLLTYHSCDTSKFNCYDPVKHRVQLVGKTTNGNWEKIPGFLSSRAFCRNYANVINYLVTKTKKHVFSVQVFPKLL